MGEAAVIQDKMEANKTVIRTNTYNLRSNFTLPKFIDQCVLEIKLSNYAMQITTGAHYQRPFQGVLSRSANVFFCSRKKTPNQSQKVDLSQQSVWGGQRACQSAVSPQGERE